jgi:hypothetical protein
MKKLKADFVDGFPHIIYFQTDSFPYGNYFQMNKDFKIIKSSRQSICEFLNLNFNLDLKYFKIEIH